MGKNSENWASFQIPFENLTIQSSNNFNHLKNQTDSFGNRIPTVLYKSLNKMNYVESPQSSGPEVERCFQSRVPNELT